MKFNFNLKNKEASLEADIEKLIDKNMDIKSNKQPKKTKYQIKLEEERKNKELEHKYMGIKYSIHYCICTYYGIY